MNLRELAVNLIEARKFVAENLGNRPNNTRGGWEIRQREAREKLPEQERAFLQEVEKNCVKVFLSGPQNLEKEFLDELKAAHSSVFVPANLYELMATRIEPTLSHRRDFTGASWARTLDVLQEFATRHNVSADAFPKEVTNITCQTFEDVVSTVKAITREAFGDRLNKAYFYASISNLALETPPEDKFVLAVFLNTDEIEKQKLQENVFSTQPNVTVVLTNEEPIKPMVEEVLKKAKSHTKKQGR